MYIGKILWERVSYSPYSKYVAIEHKVGRQFSVLCYITECSEFAYARKLKGETHQQRDIPSSRLPLICFSFGKNGSRSGLLCLCLYRKMQSKIIVVWLVVVVWIVAGIGKITCFGMQSSFASCASNIDLVFVAYPHQQL